MEDMEGGYLGTLDKAQAKKVMNSAWVVWCMNVLRKSDSNPKYNKIEQGKRYRAIMKGESAAYHAFMKSRGKDSTRKPYKPVSERYGPNFKGIRPKEETFAKRAKIKAETRKKALKRVAKLARRNKVNYASPIAIKVARTQVKQMKLKKVKNAIKKFKAKQAKPEVKKKRKLLPRGIQAGTTTY
jgi:hypothetical protein